MSPSLALFGTSADPPTVGHQAVLRGLMTLYPTVCTWASDNPFKQHGAPLNVRAALLGAVVDSLHNPGDPQHLQLRQELSSRRAIDSLEAARQRFPQHELVFVVGTDLVMQIPSWYAADQWLPSCRLAVVPRQGWQLESGALQQLEQLGARIEHLPLEIPAASSSSIRQHPNPELVPPALLQELSAQNLYGFPIQTQSASPCGSP